MAALPDIIVNPVYAVNPPAFGVMDVAFTEQIASTREAFKIFLIITAFDEPHSSQAVLEELVNISVCSFISDIFRSIDP